MADSYETFSKRIRDTNARVQKNIAVVVRKVITIAHEELTDATPVLSGRARGNWKVAVDGNSQETSSNKLSVPIVPAGTSKARAASALSGLRRDQSVIVYNNLPYIGKLNNGYSKKAPANFVEQAIARAAARDKRVKLLED